MIGTDLSYLHEGGGQWALKAKQIKIMIKHSRTFENILEQVGNVMGKDLGKSHGAWGIKNIKE